MGSKSPEAGVVQSGPFRLRYSIEGEGAPVLVVGSSVYYPRAFSQNLRDHLKFVFVDHRAHAEHGGLDAASDYALDTVLEDVERVRRHLGLGRVTLLGHSGNGFIALEYAKRYRAHVERLVLVGMGPSQSEAHRALTEARWEEAVCPDRKARFLKDISRLEADIAAAPERRFVAFCLRFGARSWYDPTFDAAPLWDGVHVNMTGVDHLWGEAFRDLDIREGLEALDIPVLLALGRFDYLVAPAVAWEPYRPLFPDLTVRIFDRSSHTPQLEEPEAFDAVLLEWMA